MTQFASKSSLYQVRDGLLSFVTNITYRDEKQVIRRLGKKAIGKTFVEFSNEGIRAFQVEPRNGQAELSPLGLRNLPISHMAPAGAWY